MWEKRYVEGDEVTKESKTNKISVFGSLFHRVGAALRNDLAPGCFLTVFSLNPQVFFVSVLNESTGAFCFCSH